LALFRQAGGEPFLPSGPRVRFGLRLLPPPLGRRGKLGRGLGLELGLGLDVVADHAGWRRVGRGAALEQRAHFVEGPAGALVAIFGHGQFAPSMIWMEPG
jgi:hypothetical protein